MRSTATATNPRPLSSTRVWLLASRPATLPASLSPVLVGTAVAGHDHRIRAAAAVLSLVVAMALQVGVNYANDYSDFRRGADTPARIGPVEHLAIVIQLITGRARFRMRFAGHAAQPVVDHRPRLAGLTDAI